MKGTLESAYRAQCGRCSSALWVTARRKENAAKTIREKGWRLTREHGWKCPKCCAEKKAKVPA